MLWSDMADPAPTEVRLAEYAALREEIQNRSGLQQTLVGLNVTVIAAVVGFVLSKHGSAPALLVLPPVLLTLGYLWLDHHRVIGELDRYIREECWTWTPRWQQASDRRRAWFWVPMGLIWIGPSAGAVVGAQLSSSLHGLRLFWWIDVALVVVFFGFFLKVSCDAS
jgi:uncharacterized membrane protein YoaK (UPF0700 family)